MRHKRFKSKLLAIFLLRPLFLTVNGSATASPTSPPTSNGLSHLDDLAKQLRQVWLVEVM